MEMKENKTESMNAEDAFDNINEKVGSLFQIDLHRKKKIWSSFVTSVLNGLGKYIGFKK